MLVKYIISNPMAKPEITAAPEKYFSPSSFANNITEDAAIQADQKERQPWQRPTLKRLRLSMDTTVEKLGSAGDGFGVTVD